MVEIRLDFIDSLVHFKTKVSYSTKRKIILDFVVFFAPMASDLGNEFQIICLELVQECCIARSLVSFVGCWAQLFVLVD